MQPQIPRNFRPLHGTSAPADGHGLSAGALSASRGAAVVSTEAPLVARAVGVVTARTAPTARTARALGILLLAAVACSDPRRAPGIGDDDTDSVTTPDAGRVGGTTSPATFPPGAVDARQGVPDAGPSVGPTNNPPQDGGGEPTPDASSGDTKAAPTPDTRTGDTGTGDAGTGDGGAPQVTPPVGDGPFNILFVGNSFTFFNDLPKTTAGMAAAKGRKLNFAMYTPGGKTMCLDWDQADLHAALLTAIKSKSWDYVVLQPWAVEASKDMIACGLKWVDQIILPQRASTKILIYMVTQNFGLLSDSQMKSEQAAYETMVKTTCKSCTLVPVLWAWQQGMAEQPMGLTDRTEVLGGWLNIHDHYHPGPRRTYIAAAAMFATIFHVNPLGLPGDTFWNEGTNALSYAVKLPAEDAAYLQKLAWTALQAHSTDPALRR